MTRTEIEEWRLDALAVIAQPDSPPFVLALSRRIVALADALLLLLSDE